MEIQSIFTSEYNMSNKHAEIDYLLKSLEQKKSLREIFEQRLHELKTSQTAIEKMFQISHRTLDGLLDGTQKRVNYMALSQLAIFLNMTTEEIFEIHVEQLKNNFETENTSANKKRFIKENFDLTVLRKANILNTVTDYDVIEAKLKSLLNLKSIFDYKKRDFSAAFWSGIIPQKSVVRNTLTRDLWLTYARNIAIQLDNPYYFNREALVKYFPQIRWHSTNLEFGLLNVIKSLFKLGITVIVQSHLSALHLRGATFVVNSKPCIVLTDYRGNYPTLWHCLVHELYHVLFDLNEIAENQYHISEDPEELLSVNQKEAEADAFAKKYLFSAEKLKEVSPYIRDLNYINEVAEENNVHPSIIHAYHAYEKQGVDRMAWIRAKRQMPEIRTAIYRLEFSLADKKPVNELIKTKKLEIYN